MGVERTAEKRGQALDIAALGQHSIGQKSLAHHTHVVGHPSRHELPEGLHEGCSIAAAIVDLATASDSPARRNLSTGKGVGRGTYGASEKGRAAGGGRGMR